MNRITTQIQAIEKGVVKLYADITFGASGAPTLVTGKGIKSVSRTSAGLFVLSLNEATQKLLDFNYTLNSGASAPAAPACYIKTNAVSTVAAPALTIVFNSVGTATDPASGEEAFITITVKNSTV